MLVRVAREPDQPGVISLNSESFSVAAQSPAGTLSTGPNPSASMNSNLNPNPNPNPNSYTDPNPDPNRNTNTDPQSWPSPGTNHGSLSARILSFYGDSPRGMVEPAVEP